MSERVFFGGILMWIGVAIMAFSGMCTLGFFFASLGNVYKDILAGRFSNGLEGAIIPLIFGGIPFLVGLGIRNLGARISGYKVKPLSKDGSIPLSKDDVEEMNK